MKNLIKAKDVTFHDSNSEPFKLVDLLIILSFCEGIDLQDKHKNFK